jgi:hypothetical protein
MEERNESRKQAMNSLIFQEQLLLPRFGREEELHVQSARNIVFTKRGEHT